MSDSDADAYLTLAGRGQARFTVRGSEFVGHVAPVRSIDEAEAFADDVRAEHPDATHNVPAYRVRADPFREYASDAGEPSGSAGKPALNVLQGRDLEDAAVVVTRYYGGTNLGIGGLVRAYSRATAAAVDDAGVVETVPQEQFSVVVAYDDSGTARAILESADVTFDADYAERVAFDVRAPVDAAPAVRDRLRSATSGRAEIDCDGVDGA
ncbi:MAG: YigZ family protein [Haloarculaceae archaeon]